MTTNRVKLTEDVSIDIYSHDSPQYRDYLKSQLDMMYTLSEQKQQAIFALQDELAAQNKLLDSIKLVLEYIQSGDCAMPGEIARMTLAAMGRK